MYVPNHGSSQFGIVTECSEHESSIMAADWAEWIKGDNSMMAADWAEWTGCHDSNNNMYIGIHRKQNI